jgi:hypothetical protein
MTVFVIFMIVWSMFNTFIALTALLGGYRNYKEIEAIKSWYPFCELMKARIPKRKGGDDK